MKFKYIVAGREEGKCHLMKFTYADGSAPGTTIYSDILV
jgi:hypothetical protein